MFAKEVSCFCFDRFSKHDVRSQAESLAAENRAGSCHFTQLPRRIHLHSKYKMELEPSPNKREHGEVSTSVAPSASSKGGDNEQDMVSIG